jgi:hypothetical protein
MFARIQKVVCGGRHLRILPKLLRITVKEGNKDFNIISLENRLNQTASLRSHMALHPSYLRSNHKLLRRRPEICLQIILHQLFYIYGPADSETRSSI